MTLDEDEGDKKNSFKATYRLSRYIYLFILFASYT